MKEFLENPSEKLKLLKQTKNLHKMNQSSRSLHFDGAVEVKSKFDAEFRRFSLEKSKFQSYDSFKYLLSELHHLQKTPFFVKYADPRDNDLLPITNDDNYFAALRNAKPLLRLVIQREGEAYDDLMRSKSGMTHL